MPRLKQMKSLINTLASRDELTRPKKVFLGREGRVYILLT